jgi:hypothetical protein
MKVTVAVTGAKETTAFLVRVEGTLKRPRALNDALARALTRILRAHFHERNQEPNKRGWPKTNFWAGVRGNGDGNTGTMVGQVSDTGATVRVGVDTFFRIHLQGGTVKPTGGRKFLTIPLVKEAAGLRAEDYERESGRKLFRPHGRRVLMERSSTPTSFTSAPQGASMRTKSGYKTFNLGAGTQVRPVYALAPQANIPIDPRALPPAPELAAALQTEADAWTRRELKKGGTAP